jgi:uncharacterized membrane protein
MFRWTRLTLWLSCLLGFGVSLREYRISPARVPVHFGLNGIPDRWGSSTSLLVIHLCLIGFSTLTFWALPELVRRAPSWMINLPNKDYWLVPERRAIAADKMAIWAHLLGIGVNVLVITLQLVLSRNAGAATATGTSTPGLVLAGFLLFALCSMVWLIASYRLPTSRE